MATATKVVPLSLLHHHLPSSPPRHPRPLSPPHFTSLPTAALALYIFSATSASAPRLPQRIGRPSQYQYCGPFYSSLQAQRTSPHPSMLSSPPRQVAHRRSSRTDASAPAHATTCYRTSAPRSSLCAAAPPPAGALSGDLMMAHHCLRYVLLSELAIAPCPLLSFYPCISRPIQSSLYLS